MFGTQAMLAAAPTGAMIFTELGKNFSRQVGAAGLILPEKTCGDQGMPYRCDPISVS
jgi:hypothetical protein